ncbi:DNA-processing protein DprA [Blautia sp. RTP21359st1_E11_RTP21359_211015]
MWKLKNGGCIVGEYEAGTRPERWRFVERDRIQAMMSDKIVVVNYSAIE